jgi:2-aminoadipate transaminase
MCLETLTNELQRLQDSGKPVKFIYTISTYQNPTGFTMPKAKRLELIDIARRFDVPVVEDNCYADVYYEGELQPALYALDDDPRQIYLCSLSKILAPGLRLGYFLAKPPMLDKLLARRHDAGSNTLAAAIVAEFYKDGVWTHTKFGNEALLKKRDQVLKGLDTHLADLCVWSKPEGGLFIWMRLPDDVDRKELWKRTQANGFGYLPGVAFHYRNANVPYLRLAFGHLTEQQIADGIPVLARCIKESRTSNEAMVHNSLF